MKQSDKDTVQGNKEHLVEKNFKIYDEVTDEDLQENGGVAWTSLVPISLAICPSTKCASITRPCNKQEVES